ncbi:MAG: hypothetical protein F2801_07655 [Actinobacteria bacterium]|nr:hypothetical protein [Actinomycetota bacterium]
MGSSSSLPNRRAYYPACDMDVSVAGRAAAWMQVFLDGDRAGHTWANLTVDHIDAHFTQLTGSRLAVGDITDAINGVRLAPVTDTGGNVITPDQWFSTGVLTRMQHT